MNDLIGLDGRPLQLCGLALPYNEKTAARLPIARGALDIAKTAPLVWQHDENAVVCKEHRVELIETETALFFTAFLPDTAAARHVAHIASSGTLRTSVQTDDFAARVDDGVIVRTRLDHIGLTCTPAHSETICWRGDFAPDDLTDEQRRARSRFCVGSMTMRVCDYTATKEAMAHTRGLAIDLNACAKARKLARARELAAADSIVDDMNSLIDGRRTISAAVQAALGRESAHATKGARPGLDGDPRRRPGCPVAGETRP